MAVDSVGWLLLLFCTNFTVKEFLKLNSLLLLLLILQVSNDNYGDNSNNLVASGEIKLLA